MKKTVIVTLELDTENNPSDKEIESDIRQEINCASYYYDVKDVQVLNTHKGDGMNDNELLSMIESYLEDHESSDLMRVVADALESVGH